MIENLIKNIHSIQTEEYLRAFLFENEKYQSNNRLNKYEFQVFSQQGEDGIIEEIFNRIGVTNRFFVEFGVQNGTECNTAYLLFKGWKGLWIDGAEQNLTEIRASCKGIIDEKRLIAIHSFITTGNIELLFRQAGVPVELDLLSIDIDGNDYYIWQAITNYHPRVLIIEYNSIFRPGVPFVIPYKEDNVWDGSSNFGASLQSLYELGLQKGYSLVACDFTGTNAFFVQNDLVNDLFEAPFTPENHYEPSRYFLSRKEGYPRKFLL
jgi:hypothetical protein